MSVQIKWEVTQCPYVVIKGAKATTDRVCTYPNNVYVLTLNIITALSHLALQSSLHVRPLHSVS